MMLELSRPTGKIVELSCERTMIVKKRHMESKYNQSKAVMVKSKSKFLYKKSVEKSLV